MAVQGHRDQGHRGVVVEGDADVPLFTLTVREKRGMVRGSAEMSVSRGDIACPVRADTTTAEQQLKALGDS
jgi:hypothetical protein